MTSLNGRIARVKKNRHWIEDGVVYCRLGGEKRPLVDDGCGCPVKKRTPDYSGDLVASDGLLEEIVAKGHVVAEWREIGSRHLEVWELDQASFRAYRNRDNISENRADAWLAVFDDPGD